MCALPDQTRATKGITLVISEGLKGLRQIPALRFPRIASVLNRELKQKLTLFLLVQGVVMKM